LPTEGNGGLMSKSNTQAKRDERARKRAAGLVPKEIWPHPLDWPAIKKYIDRKANKRISAMMNAKTDKAELISSAKELDSVKEKRK